MHFVEIVKCNSMVFGDVGVKTDLTTCELLVGVTNY